MARRPTNDRLRSELDRGFGAGTADRVLSGRQTRPTATAPATGGEVNWQAIQAMAEANATTKAGTILLVHENGFTSEVQRSAVGRYLGQGYRIATQTEMRQYGYEPRNAPVSGGSGTATPAEGGSGATTPNRNFRREARLLFPWIPDSLVRVFSEAWEDYGDVELALSQMRQDSRYDQFFPGNRRDDGTVRLAEGEYLSTVEGYNRERGQFGMSTLSADLQRTLVEGDVSPNEYGRRLGNAFTTLASNIDAVREDYAQRWGARDLSVAALLESYVDPDVNPLEAERRVRVAQIGGEARLRGQMLSTDEASLFASYGLDQQAARSVFGEASGLLPTLNALEQRHNDPDDPFTFTDLSEALVVQDPSDLERVARLFAQQRSTFSSGGFAAVAQSGGQRGLLSR